MRANLVKNNTNLVMRRKITGQGMTEYIIIVALIAVAAIAAVGFFGSAVQSQFASLGQELLGEDGDAKLTDAKTAGGAITTEAKTLGNYTAN